MYHLGVIQYFRGPATTNINQGGNTSYGKKLNLQWRRNQGVVQVTRLAIDFGFFFFLWWLFKLETPNCQIKKEKVEEFISTVMPCKNAETFVRHIFRAFDKDGNNVLDFPVSLEGGASGTGSQRVSCRSFFNLPSFLWPPLHEINYCGRSGFVIRWTLTLARVSTLHCAGLGRLDLRVRADHRARHSLQSRGRDHSPTARTEGGAHLFWKYFSGD